MARIPRETPNGYEFISTILATWAEEHDVQLEFIQLGKPIQNSYVERFNRTYRTEILDMSVFKTLTEVRELKEDWIREYNEELPHGAMDDLTPLEYLMKHEKAENSKYGCKVYTTINTESEPYQPPINQGSQKQRRWLILAHIREKLYKHCV